MTVLLLDAAWRIDRVISVERACELLLGGRVIAASEDIAAVMHSPSITLEVPSVIARFGSTGSYPRRQPVCSHRKVRVRDQHLCQFVIDGLPCERRGDSVDHLVPRSFGGPTSWSNCVAACRAHNHTKADRTMEEMTRRFGWALRRLPVAPPYGVLLSASLVSQNPAWRPFLEGV
jgi:5-methylcytosine-specific restriction endonuclease McrA